MRLIGYAKCDVHVCCRWVFEDSFVAIMCLQPEGIRKRLRPLILAPSTACASSSDMYQTRTIILLS